MSKQQMRLRFIEGGEGGGGQSGTAHVSSEVQEAFQSASPKPVADGPDDEPLGEAGKKALEAERQTVKDLRAELKALKDAAAAKATAPRSESKSDDNSDVSADIAALRQQLADEKAAREEAETKADIAAISVTTGVPAALIHGSTHEERQASADAAVAWRGTGPSGPQPNPQQGTPPGKTGGSIASGRDRYKQSHSS